MSGSLIRRKKCPYSELFWSVFSRIQTEYFVYCILRLNTSVRMQENTDQRNSKYGHFSHSVIDLWWSKCLNSVKGNDSDTNNVNCYFFEIFLVFLFFFLFLLTLKMSQIFVKIFIKLKHVLVWWRLQKNINAWKVSKYGAFLVHIFLYSDWIQKNTDRKNSVFGQFSRSAYISSKQLSVQSQQ